MLQNQVAPTVTKFEKEFSIPTFTILTKLTDYINVPAQYRAFITVTDILNWCQSPAGVDYLLSSCSKLTTKQVKELGNDYSRFVFAQELCARFMGYGEILTEQEKIIADTDAEEKVSVPLVETSQSGE